MMAAQVVLLGSVRILHGEAAENTDIGETRCVLWLSTLLLIMRKNPRPPLAETADAFERMLGRWRCDKCGGPAACVIGSRAMNVGCPKCEPFPKEPL